MKENFIICMEIVAKNPFTTPNRNINHFHVEMLGNHLKTFPFSISMVKRLSSRDAIEYDHIYDRHWIVGLISQMKAEEQTLKI